MPEMATLDTARLASFSGLPQSNIEVLTQQPTVELVTAFLAALVPVAQNYDRIKSENLRLTVEQEHTIHGAETKARGLKATADKALQEVDSLRRKLDEEERAKNALDRKFRELEASSSSSASEVEGLQSRIKQLEKSNRDTLSLLEAKSTAFDKLSHEITAHHQKTIELRRETSALQEKLTNAENHVNNARFKESSLQQEIELLKRSNDWLDTELKTKNADHVKFRKEKNARIAELQRSFEDAQTTIESLRRTEKNLRKRLEETAAKADEAFVKIQQLQDEATRAADLSRAELDTAKRLAALQEQSATTAKRRVQELDDVLDSIKQDAADEIGQLQAELESERENKEALETRVEELVAHVDQLESKASAQGSASLTATPRPSRNALTTPTRARSPAVFSPASARGRTGQTMTQLYDEYNQLRSELAAEKNRNAKLSTTMDEMIRDLEQKGPELEELEGDRQHLTKELNRITGALNKAVTERDVARKETRKSESQIETLHREADLLRQQLRDLSAQIKILLAETHVRNDGTELSQEERLLLQQAARSGDNGVFDGMSDTGKFISQQLVTFRNIFELQETNAKLLHLTRTLGEQMEGEEARAKQNVHEEEHRELLELREKVSSYADEIQSLLTQSQSYVAERDMFRRMLSHRGQLPQDADLNSMFGRSVNGLGSPAPSRPDGGNADQTAATAQLNEHIKLLREMQSQYDAYRQDAATDHQTLKAQVDGLSKDKSDLQREIAKISSQLTLAHERYELLNSNYKFMKSESEEAQRRAQTLAESAAKQDLRTQQVAEELVESKTLAESMRNETANLKAEKDLWKRIESRLLEENQKLSEERSQQSKAIADSQSLANQRELADGETRRKLETQIGTLEQDLRNTSRKLEESQEEKRRDDMRREYESEQNRTRIDDLVASLGNTKEELSAAKTLRDQLQARVDELKIDLRNAEERAQALQPRPTPRPGGETSQQTDENALTREQELAVDLADTKRELDLTKAELENAKVQVEQYKQISQTSEEELQSLTETQEQYREEMDLALAEKDSKIQELEQRLADISEELSVNNRQLSELQNASEESNARLEQQRIIFEEELARVKDESDRHLETARFHQEDLKAQAEIAQQAQQSYEAELVKHAEAAKALQKVRADYNQTKLEVSQARADADAARTILSQNEESWNDIKDQYEKEISDMKQRREDVDKQNKILHQQLENVSAQIAGLQQQRANGSSETEQEVSESSSNLQEVIRYLRREKEIVDVQYELSVQEARRLKQQLNFTQSSLEEVRLKLDQERHKSAEEGRSSMTHAKLMDTINELNVFRESSVTLRNEARQAQAQLTEKTKQLEELFTQIEPLKAEVLTTQNELEIAQGEIALAKEDRDRWQARMQNILQKYDRIDPAELEALKEKITQLEQERNEATAEKATLQTRIDGFPDEITQATAQATEAIEASWKERRERLVEQFKDRSRNLSASIRTKDVEIQALKDQVSSLQTELDTTRAARDEAVDKVNTAAQQQEEQPEEQTEAEGDQMDVDQAAKAELEASLATAKQQLQQEIETAAQLRARVDELEQELAQVRESLTTQDSDEHLDKLRADLENAQQELTALRASSSISKDVEAERAETAAVAETNIDHSQEVQKAEESLRAKMTKEREASLQTAQAQHDQKIQQLNDEHSSELTRMKQEYESEISKMQARAEAVGTPNSVATPTKSAAPPGSENAFNADSTPVIKDEISSFEPPAGWVPPMQLVKTWISSVPAVKDLLRKNIQTRTATALEEARVVHDAEIEKLKEEFEVQKQALGQEFEAQKQILNEQFEAQKQSLMKGFEDEKQTWNTQKDRAVMMEGKKFAAKLSLTEGKLKMMLPKMDVIQKAAAETPERPVGEVWEVAKVAKPADAKVPAEPAPPAAAAAPASVPATAEATASIPQPTAPAAVPNPATAVIENPTAATATASTEQSSDAAAPPTDQSKPTEAPKSKIPAKPPVPARGGAALGSGIPRGGTAAGGANRGRGGGIPVAGGSSLPRGGGNARGRGAAAGAGNARGGPATAANSRGGMNPGANTFQPGNKRPRESSAGSGAAENISKRPRGGGNTGT